MSQVSRATNTVRTTWGHWSTSHPMEGAFVVILLPGKKHGYWSESTRSQPKNPIYSATRTGTRGTGLDSVKALVTTKDQKLTFKIVTDTVNNKTLRNTVLTDMKLSITITLLIVLTVWELPFVISQTFQYSRGWTNGRKRNDDFITEMIARKLMQVAKFSNQREFDNFRYNWCRYAVSCPNILHIFICILVSDAQKNLVSTLTA